jgi:hypothetical protein
VSSPIKPTGGGVTPPSIEAPRASREPFHEALERAEAPAAADSPPRGEWVGGPELADHLVERALASAVAAGLAPAKRAELEAHLRRTLRDDPAVASLLRDLSRGA